MGTNYLNSNRSDNDALQSILAEILSDNVLAGEQSVETQQIDNWVDPIYLFNLFKKELERSLNKENTSQYEHNVIIQVGNDEKVALSIAKLLKKYENKAIVMQFDIGSQQWKILYGDLTIKSKGKVRWIVVGHGKYIGENQESNFEGSQSRHFVDGLKYLKYQVLKDHQPSKIVLAGCELGRGGVSENFAFRTGVELAKHGIYLPVVGYSRDIAITKESKKKVSLWGFSRERISTKNYRLEININPIDQQVYINNKLASVFFIDELRKGELEVWQLIIDNHSTAMDIFRDKLNDNNIDIELIKKIAYNDNAYKIFEQKIKDYTANFDSEFRKELINEFNKKGIIETPLWPMINIEDVNTSSESKCEDLTVIFRSGSGSTGKMYTERLTASAPDSTLVFQVNPNTMQFFVEHGDIEKLNMLSQQQWVIIDSIHSEAAFIQNLANSLDVVKQRYDLRKPENISLYLTDKKHFLDQEDKFSFTQQLTIRLKEKGINSNVNLERHFDAKSKLRSLLENISLGYIERDDISINRFNYLKGYFTLEDGSIDHDKMKVAIYDPIVSEKINKYMLNETENGDLISWNAIFDDDPKTSVKQQAIEIKKLLNFLSLQPDKIKYLGKVSSNRLAELFPAERDFNHSDVLKLINDAVKLEEFNKDIENFLISYIEIKTPLDDNKSLAKEFEYITEIKNRQKINSRDLLHILNENKMEAKVTITEPPVFYGDSVHFLYLLINSDLTEVQKDKIKSQLDLLKNLTRKNAVNELTSSETSILDKYNEIYEKNGGILESVVENIDNQAHSVMINNIENNQIIYFQSDNEIYTLTSYVNNDLYHLSLLDSAGVEMTISDSDFAVAKEKLLDIFTRFINQNVKQGDEQPLTRGQQAGFSQRENGDLYGEVQIINTKNTAFQNAAKTIIIELDTIFEPAETSIIDEIEMIFGEQRTTLKKLQNAGATIDGELLNKTHIQQKNWQDKLQFDEQKLSCKLTSITNEAESIELVLMLQNSVNESDYEKRISNGTTIQNQAILKEQLSIIRNAKVNESELSEETIHKLQKSGMKLPIYSRVANSLGQGIGGMGMFLTINNIYQLLDELDNPNLAEQERHELQRNLDLACANAFFNYGDMILQPILLKIAYKQAGSFNASGQITARITLIFNLIGMGLDVYQACDAFRQLDTITNSKERQDLMVNGGLSIANIVVGGITVLGILIGSSTLPVVGLIVAGALLIGGMIYTGIRAVEKIEQELGESLKWDEKAKEGIRAALGFKPSDNILNRFSHKQHIEFYKDVDWQRDLELFKNTFLHLEFEEHLQLISMPTLDVNDKYYIKYWASKNVIQSRRFVDDSSDSILSHIDVDEVGPCYTIEQINYIRDNFFYDGGNRRWVKSTLSKETNYLNFNWRFSLIDKEAPFSFKEVGKQETDDIIVLNTEYNSGFLELFLQNENMHLQYNLYKKKSLLEQINLLSEGDLRFFRTRNKYSNISHPDFLSDEKLQSIGHEYISSPKLIYDILNTEKEEIVYEGMQNIGYSVEREARKRNISVNFGGGKDLVIGRKLAKNAFIFHSGVKFFAGGDKDDVISIYFKDILSTSRESKVYFDGGDGNNGVVINDIPENSQVHIDLNSMEGELLVNNNTINKLYLKNTKNITLNGQYNSMFALYGDDEENIFDIRGGECFVNAGAGDDRIYFESGIVTGDEGNDTFFLRRYHYSQSQINSNHDDINISATIIENEKGASTVYLGYSLKEIKSVTIINNDIVVTIKIDNDMINPPAEFHLTLKNAYVNEGENRQINHNYQLITNDGFILTSKNNDDNKVYIVNYQKNFNTSNRTSYANKTANIKTNENIIIVGDDSYLLGDWALVEFVESREGLIYHGSDENEKIILSNINNKVMVSKGEDLYQIVTDNFLQGKLVFDFSEVQNSYSEKDSITIKFFSVNGYDLKLDNRTVYLENKLGDRELEIDFINYNSLSFEKITILDGKNKLFRLSYDGCKINLTSKNDTKISDDSDYIHFQPYDTSSEGIIDLQSGNDVMFDESMSGNIINAGSGNDKIVAVSGSNILYGGTGNDTIYGGDKTDLLLSDFGDDILDGMEGDDYYIIKGNESAGEAIICDDKGNNHVYLINFQKEYRNKTIEGELYRIYTSKSNKRTVKIKMPQEIGSRSMTVHHYEQLPSYMPNYVNENMSHLVRYLAEQKNYAKQITPLIPYHPFDAFKSGFNHQLPEAISLTKKLIRISPQANPHQSVIHTSGREQKVWDTSGHGRVFKAEAAKGLISIPNGYLANNVLYAKQSETNLSGGDGDDVLIVNGANGLLTDEMGENVFVINGDLPGWNSLYSLGGENTIYLVNFKQNVIREAPDHISNATRYLYESENGRTLKIFQYPNTQAPTIVHQQWDDNGNIDVVSQRLDYLVNTLASLRMQDETTSVNSHYHNEAFTKWAPVKLVKSYMNRVS